MLKLGVVCFCAWDYNMFFVHFTVIGIQEKNMDFHIIGTPNNNNLFLAMSSIPNHYETLKVPQNASAEQIKASYRELMLKFHPDKNPPNDPVALEISQKINAANDILGDEQKRRDYDKELHESSGTSSTTSDGSSSKGYTNFGTSSEGTYSTFNNNFGFGYFPDYENIFGGFKAYTSSGFTYSRSHGSQINSCSNNLKIFVFSNKILVQSTNKIIKEANNIEINGASNNFKIYGNNIYIENENINQKKIVGKSVKIEVNGPCNFVIPRRRTAYIFSEEFKRLKPTGNITSINGASNTIEVTFRIVRVIGRARIFRHDKFKNRRLYRH
uniref:J domain-containing protein n=1 Tax=Meloidogyne enterolobii TaxID=390850 RepID=A0A6V7VUE0_MELEN|nr:unnamed protein product [Meloidogyne enterolobii]